jgi:hypothetical protein
VSWQKSYHATVRSTVAVLSGRYRDTLLWDEDERWNTVRNESSVGLGQRGTCGAVGGLPLW